MLVFTGVVGRWLRGGCLSISLSDFGTHSLVNLVSFNQTALVHSKGATFLKQRLPVRRPDQVRFENRPVPARVHRTGCLMVAQTEAVHLP